MGAGEGRGRLEGKSIFSMHAAEPAAGTYPPGAAVELATQLQAWMTLEAAAAEWDATTDRIGVDVQKATYAEFKKLPGAYADNTIEKLGMAVKLD